MSEPEAIRVLCVDDEPNLLAALRRLLRRRFAITIADGAEQALHLLQSEPAFDVVISDLSMPGIDGAELLRRVASVSPDSVRILLTGHGSRVLADRGIEDGVVHRYVSKPFPPLELAEILEFECERMHISRNEIYVAERGAAH